MLTFDSTFLFDAGFKGNWTEERQISMHLKLSNKSLFITMQDARKDMLAEKQAIHHAFI